MKFSNTVLLSIMTALTSTVSAGCSYEGGNYFCSEVSAVTYQNVGYSGTYKDVTNMDESSCQCTQESVSFSGTNSPLDEELSVHFRGPVKLLQFAVYSGSSSSSSKKVKRDENDCTTTKHVHHAHKREAATAIVQVTETVYVNAQGEKLTSSGTQTIVTNAAPTTGETTTLESSPAAGNTAWSSSPVNDDTTTAEATPTSSQSSSSTKASSTQTSATASSTATSGDWTRSSYYTPGSVDNVVFLNTLGGTDSGVWSSCFGNSLSYAGSDGTSTSSSAVALGEVTLGSDDEYVIFSGASCNDGNDGCGYYREGIPAYHGFGGSEKIFLFEFEMPHDSSSSGASNPDMPAIWLLNAKIPRTLQYGDSTCSCWSTGCGELDLFEILAEGDERLISHLHDGQGKDGTSTGGTGSQDYFARPTSSSMKAAVVFSADKTISIVQLDDSTDFSSALDASTVSKWLSTSGSTAYLS
ncbi:CYFA0S09e01750g1_1 [Cyberlindnera fabianii]|uniref:glucan endo-1,3-beta-D-glucosidase n=1 Tax=Cyberlindnera fabianii TaxID=36022 RepID=A0A061B5Q0_CYBFA|nr:Protein TOS1 [Cyberlindnera fabianii]CDR42350.1 CYFA0S09e01750g1_1 [Cyberlindnera fabianii]